MCRSLFVPIMINSLTRLGLPGQSALENRILSVDLAATLLWWDRKGADEQAQRQAPVSMEVDAEGLVAAEEGTEPPKAPNADTAEASSQETRLTSEMDDMIVNFLLRMAFVSCEVRDRDETGWRKLHVHCLEVLRDAAHLRPPSALKMHYFEKFLQQNLHQQQQQAQQAQQQGHLTPEASPALVTGLRIANIFLEFQPDNFVACCANQLAMMMDPALGAKHRSPVELLASGVRLLFGAYPAGVLTPGNTAGLAVKLQNRVQEVIAKYVKLPAALWTYA